MTLARLSFWVGLVAASLATAGIVGANMEAISPLLGFRLFVLGFFVSIPGAMLEARRLFGEFKDGGLRKLKVPPLVGGGSSITIFVAVLVLLFNARNYPRINDITTDTDRPPEFVHAPQLPANRGRNMRYDRARFAEAQTAGYDDLVPLRLEVPPSTAFNHVKVAAARMEDWEITYTDPATMTVEGVSTSRVFRFKDDFVIQVRAARDGTSLVEMRSKSRQGVSDFGANYRRIKAFFAKMKSLLWLY